MCKRIQREIFLRQSGVASTSIGIKDYVEHFLLKYRKKTLFYVRVNAVYPLVNDD